MPSNKAMKAAHADVLGHEVPRLRRRRGQASRNLSGQRAMFTQPHSRTSYRGTSPNRSAKVAGGHPLGGLWQSWEGMARSYNPRIRKQALRHIAATDTPVPAWVDEMVGYGE